MADKFIPRNGSVPVVANTTVEDSSKTINTDNIVVDGVKFPSDPKKRSVQGIVYVALGLVLAAISFWIACLVINNFEVGWFIKSLIAVAFSAIVINTYNKATGQQPSALKAPITSFTIILFVLCLLTGYQNAHGKSAGALFDRFFFAKLNESALVEEEEDKKASSSESWTVKTIGDIWFASHVFSRGDKIKITVEYNAVQMTGGQVLEPGIYEEIMDGDGQIMFEGITTNPSKITITY